MSEQLYKVRSITWLAEAGSFDEFKAHDDEGAADLWCRHMERNGNFADGYPQNHELEVTWPDGTITTVNVDTDFEPHYFTWSRGPRLVQS